jgi:hypothetical protein
MEVWACAAEAPVPPIDVALVVVPTSTVVDRPQVRLSEQRTIARDFLSYAGRNQPHDPSMNNISV